MGYPFYAVRKGKTVGIVTSWDECKEMTAGVSRAEYKGFNNEDDALEYLRTGNVPVASSGVDIHKPEQEGEVNAYIRAGFANDRMDIGIVLESSTKTYRFFGQLLASEYQRSRGIAAELVAALVAVQLCCELKFTQVNIIYSYDGVEKWADGTWSAKDYLPNVYVYEMHRMKQQFGLKYCFKHAKKSDCVFGMLEADTMVKRSKNLKQYIDLEQVLQGRLRADDVPLFSVT